VTCIEGPPFMSPYSGWSNDLDWRFSGLTTLSRRTGGMLAAKDLSCSADSSTKRADDGSSTAAARIQAATFSVCGFWHVASFHACRSAVWIHLFCARLSAVRPESSTTVTSAFRRSKTDVECSWPSRAFDNSQQEAQLLARQRAMRSSQQSN